MTETEQERFKRESGWVKARFECTGDSIFQTLIAVMESDVASFNKLAGEAECTVNRNGGREVKFVRGQRVAAVVTDGSAIWAEVYSNAHQMSRIDVESKWNDAKMTCDLFIEGEQVSMHRASQKIIGGVLFP
ncbi:MAG: hypothetical protein OYG32_06645 [Rhodospirillaceae bacterium]|nr:hypothetical protein [Rhodospirillaceae bacterium]